MDADFGLLKFYLAHMSRCSHAFPGGNKSTNGEIAVILVLKAIAIGGDYVYKVNT